MDNIECVRIGGWQFYLSVPNPVFDRSKVGKWMFFSNDIERCNEVTYRAVQENIVSEAKYSYPDGGVCCFYLHIDDMDGHRRVISFFRENNMIQKTKTGKYYNISFKLDEQTDAGEYGEDYRSELKLEQIMDLVTGEWK